MRRTTDERRRRRNLADHSVTAATPVTGPACITREARDFRARHGDPQAWAAGDRSVYLGMGGAS